MTHEEAVRLIAGGVPQKGGTWADLGAGSGVFSRALADLLGPEGRVHALDRDARVLDLDGRHRDEWAPIHAQRADFRQPLPLSGLDGILMANALHFTNDHARVLATVLAALRWGGAFVLVEYDLSHGTPWIPHPVSRVSFERSAAAAGLRDVHEIGRMPSRYGARDIYAAVGTLHRGEAR